jgi:hypothetical protein
MHLKITQNISNKFLYCFIELKLYDRRYYSEWEWDDDLIVSV